MVDFIIAIQVIAAEGEQKASRALRDASDVIADAPSALQLRYLQVRLSAHLHIKHTHTHTCTVCFHTPLFQTLNTISAEKNSTIGMCDISCRLSAANLAFFEEILKLS